MRLAPGSDGLFFGIWVGYPSGQREQTVNLPAYAFEGSNPSPTITGTGGAEGAEAQKKHFENCGSSSVGRALAFQACGRGFESRLPLPAVQSLA